MRRSMATSRAARSTPLCPPVTIFIGQLPSRRACRMLKSAFSTIIEQREDASMQPAEIAQLMLMYFVLPLWLAAGFADYLCHRASDIEHTSGAKESLLHLLLFAEMGVPVLAAIFL